jgi:hypothetical protein
MISEAIFQSFPTLSQSTIIKNGFGVPSWPAYETEMVTGAYDSANSRVSPTTRNFDRSGASTTGPDAAMSWSF